MDTASGPPPDSKSKSEPGRLIGRLIGQPEFLVIKVPIQFTCEAGWLSEAL